MSGPVTTPPVKADAGGPYTTAFVFEAVELDGSGSTGPDNKVFAWTVESVAGRPDPMLKDVDKSSARLMAMQAGTYRVTLTLTADGDADNSQVEIEFRDRAQAPIAPTTDDEIWWRDKFIESRRTALTRVQDAAQKWQALLATAVGIFGTVAFVTGPTALDKLPAPQAAATAVIVLFAFVLALSALLFSAAAGHGSPERKDAMDGRVFKRETLVEYNRSYRYLRNAQTLTLLAVSSIVIGTLVAWSTTLLKETSGEGTMALVRQGGQVFCGELEPKGTSTELSLGGKRIVGAEEVTIVDSCPSSSSTTTWIDANKAGIRGAIVALVLILAAAVGWLLGSASSRDVGLGILAVAALLGIVYVATQTPHLSNAILFISASLAAVLAGLGLRLFLTRVVTRL